MTLFSFLARKKSSGVFVPTLDGFKEYTGPIERGSFNDVTESMGYHIDQIEIYYDFDSRYKSLIHGVAFEVFSDNIAFVLTKDTVRNLSRVIVNRYLKKFSLSKVFDSYNVENILERGIENRSLSTDFLTKVLLIRNSQENGIFHIDSIGHYLIFSGGYLSDYVSSDGLNKWAKDWKESNPSLLNRYVEDSRKWWGNDQFKMVESEINAQADAFASIPGGWRNEFIDLHRTPANTVNFVMLQVCHHSKPISLDKFKEINYGRCKEFDTNLTSNFTRYQVGRIIYTFSLDGQLVEAVTDDSFTKLLI